VDLTDIQIINILKRDARTSIKEISAAVNLSAPSVKERMDKMRSAGIIKAYTVILDPRAMGKTMKAFMFLTLRNPEKAERFMDVIAKEQDILSCYFLTGDFDYMIEIVTQDTVMLEKMISELRNLAEFSRTRTIIVLTTIKEVYSVSP